MNVMHRTTLVLPTTLKAKIQKEAEKDHVSMGEFIRKAIEKYLSVRHEALVQDSFLASETFFCDDGPVDGAQKHDAYLARGWMGHQKRK